MLSRLESSAPGCQRTHHGSLRLGNVAWFFGHGWPDVRDRIVVLDAVYLVPDIIKDLSSRGDLHHHSALIFRVPQMKPCIVESRREFVGHVWPNKFLLGML